MQVAHPPIINAQVVTVGVDNLSDPNCDTVTANVSHVTFCDTSVTLFVMTRCVTQVMCKWTLCPMTYNAEMTQMRHGAFLYTGNFALRPSPARKLHISCVREFPRVSSLDAGLPIQEHG